MYNKVVDFTQSKILTDINEEHPIPKEKIEFVSLILDEGLSGFFGVDKEELVKIKEKENSK